MIKDGNYITFQGWMITRLHLFGNRLIAYAIIYGFSQNRESVYDGGLEFMSEWMDGNNGEHASIDTARRVLNSLVNDGIIGKQEREGKTTLYWCIPLANCYPLQIATPSKLQPLANDNESPLLTPPNPLNDSNTPYTPSYISPERSGVVANNSSVNNAYAHTQETSLTSQHDNHDDDHLSFDYWWNLYSHGQFMEDRKRCKDYWDRYSNEIRGKIIKHSEWFAINNFQSKRPKTPYWYLHDEIWMGEKPSVNITPLTGSQADMAKRSGDEVWNCKLPNGTFGLVMKRDADKFGLEKIWKL